ncbi:MAG: PEP/pyruvate-binding domain-containing protein [Desulfobacterales bacterium]
MGRIRDLLTRWVSTTKPSLSPDAAEQLRIAFKERYHHFKLLLSANLRALERMADIEAALAGSEPFGMTFIRSASTEITVNVLRMIQSMEKLAPGKYPELRPRFREIRKAIQDLVEWHPRSRSGIPLVVPIGRLDRAWSDQAGGKMANLGEIRNRVRLEIPDGFVATTAAYDLFLEHSGLQEEINRLIQSADKEDTTSLFVLSSRIQQSILRAPIPSDLEAAITSAWEDLAALHGKDITVALRSSSLFEDTEASSFAGQFRTELNVSRDHLLEAYREVVASKYSLQALTYRLNRGYRDEDITVAVGCMVMVDAVAGGVAYSTSPVNPVNRSVHIDGTWGLPKTVVDGSSGFDSFIVARAPELRIVESVIGHKDSRLVCYPEEGVCRLDTTGDIADKPCLTPSQILDISRIALEIEAYYGLPQDIEWAVGPDGRIVVLQCRPLRYPSTGSSGEPDEADLQPDAELLLDGGVTASPGTCSGPVFRAHKSADALRFPSGAVLVVRQAAPHWATLISRSAGVVSEQGGVAGHLANVAREFGVPAIFGCAGAMERLAPGREVTLDADRRRIYAGRIESLLSRPKNLPNPMAGSPVYQLLAAVSRLIVPLNLLDPTSREFHPENCRTLHDITRFLHEKSVNEMFGFGREHQFPERSSKQLFFDVPMQWWVLNLDDGFLEEVAGKYVHLDNIACEPMLAFWEGFTAVRWEGPPPLDHKGFASVLFQSTANTALTPGRQSRFAEKNYFMISRNYCNLSSRLGYHFATMEALVSDRATENYVTFQFKGGAADLHRRLKRVQFIGDILEHYGFRVEIREDHLAARIENYDRHTMRSRLKILGYLSLHTRQLDMIMESPTRVRFFRDKIHLDLTKFVSPGDEIRQAAPVHKIV